MPTARCIFLVGLLSLAAMAGDSTELFQKAPPDVDQALRERAKMFLQAHVDGKFRLADQYVADESKDAFFEAHKRRYDNFEIVKITYSEQYTKAVVLAACGAVMAMPASRTALPVKMPVKMYWKIVDGKWFWYVPPAPAFQETPFGKMKLPPGNPAGVSAPVAPAGFDQRPSLASLGQMASVDKNEVSLGPATPSATVILSNKMPGRMTARVEGPVPEGLKAKLEPQEVQAGETAKLILELADAAQLNSGPYTIRLLVEPINQVFVIKVNVPMPIKK
jgi:hypothetical protein